MWPNLFKVPQILRPSSSVVWVPGILKRSRHTGAGGRPGQMGGGCGQTALLCTWLSCWGVTATLLPGLAAHCCGPAEAPSPLWLPASPPLASLHSICLSHEGHTLISCPPSSCPRWGDSWEQGACLSCSSLCPQPGDGHMVSFIHQLGCPPDQLTPSLSLSFLNWQVPF